MVGAGIHRNQHASRCARRLHFEQPHAATRGSLAFQMRLCEPASAVDNEGIFTRWFRGERGTMGRLTLMQNWEICSTRLSF